MILSALVWKVNDVLYCLLTVRIFENIDLEKVALIAVILIIIYVIVRSIFGGGNWS